MCCRRSCLADLAHAFKSITTSSWGSHPHATSYLDFLPSDAKSFHWPPSTPASTADSPLPKMQAAATNYNRLEIHRRKMMRGVAGEEIRITPRMTI